MISLEIKPKLMFLPGGPNISGKYIDHFRSKFKTSSSRLSYLNHEKDYLLTKGTSFEQICDKIVSEIESQNMEINLVCHSFGGMIALSICDSPIYKKFVRKTILVSTPLSSIRSNLFYERISHLASTKVTTNHDYLIQLHQILPIYFYDEHE